jgi:glutathione S-transferase
MSKPKLTFVDAPVSRGEECRLALHIAGVDFEDVRIKQADWPTLKPTTPWGSLPLFELPGHPVLAQTNAILALIGRLHGLHPTDNFEAARHESMMLAVEDLRATVAATMRIKDDTAKKSAREDLSTGYLPTWGANAERQLGDGPFFAGSRIHVVDLKIHMALRWLKSGVLDHIPATVLDAFPKLNRVHDAVGDHERVKAWRAQK